ncbi:MAG: phytochrome sensor protein [Planctomycetaceae bacterium]|nr:phytochrome sensor protein [Planctomycetaceae bacterium]
MALQKNSAKLSWLITLASIAIVIGGLYFAKGVLLPLIVAVLVSFLLSPICDWLEHRRIGRVPAVLTSVILTFVVFGAVSWIAFSQLTDLATNMSKYQTNIETKLKLVNQYVGSAWKSYRSATQKIGEKISPEDVMASSTTGASISDHPYSVRVIATPPSALEYFGGMFGTVLEAAGAAGIVIVLVLFFLFEREDLRDRFIRLVGQGQVTGTTDALGDATTRVSRYLLMQLLVNVGFGVTVSSVLFLIGVPNAVLWGILTAIMKFVPYVGVWISAAAPIALSMAVTSTWAAPFMTLGLYVVLEFFVGSFLEPWLFGKHTGVSPVAILVAAIFWSWLWGGVGLLLATPLTVCLLVIGKHVPQLSFLDTLLGDEPVFEPKLRVYQRLLAGDQEEAIDLIGECRQEQSLAEIYDTVLIPAISLAERDRYRDEIDQYRLEFILQNLKGIIEELGEAQDEIRATEAAELAADGEPHVEPPIESSPRKPELRVLCLPASSDADEIGAIMLAQIARNQGALSQAVPLKGGFEELEGLVGDYKMDVICISALAPAAVTRARRISRQIRARFSKTRIIVALLNFKGELAAAKVRIGCGPATQVVSSLHELEEQLKLLIEPASQPQPAKQARQVVENQAPLLAVAK